MAGVHVCLLQTRFYCFLFPQPHPFLPSLFFFLPPQLPFLALCNTCSAPRSLLSGRAGSREQISSNIRETDSGCFPSSLCSHFQLQPFPHLKGSQRLSEREKYVNVFSFKKEVYLSYSLIKCPSRLCLFNFFFFLTFDC